MICKLGDNLLQDYIDGDLPASQADAISVHLKTCSICETKLQEIIRLRSMLRELPVPGYSDGFVDGALKQASKGQKSFNTSMYKVFGGAIAAGLMAWFIVAGILMSPSTEIQNHDNDIFQIAVNEQVQTIKVAIESEKALSSVQMSIVLTPNLELSGYGSRKTIDWNTPLKKGTNVIRLPIVGLAYGDGEIITRVQMDGKEKTMRIRTNYKLPEKVLRTTNRSIEV